MTNALMNPASTSLTMSSREIADLTGKRHDNVMADIRTMLDELGIMSPEFSGHIQIPGPNGGFRTSPVFNLPKDLTLTIVSGYSVVMRHRIITRWMELEAQQAPKAYIPATYGEALMLAAVNQQKVEVLETEKAIAAPKVAVYDSVVAEKNITLMEFCRMLPGVNIIKIYASLKEQGVFYRTGTSYRVYAKYRDVCFKESIDSRFGKHDFVLLDEGKKLVTALYQQGKLIMRKDFR